ncbi:MAG TPA: CPBP family intramembrane glutamic endopeptidase [Vicinamibacterales bacterium]|nr:CPBP family intramembrane glutamic endopeptidase [Vicinamibacterales bacterium]
MARAVALIEVLLCSGFPTQIALGATLMAFGVAAETPQHALRVGYVVGISLADSAAVIGLVFLFLLTHGERPREVLLGNRRSLGEALAGIPLIVVALLIAAAALTAIQHVMPSLHTVEHNPLQELMKTPRNAWLFVLVALVAGGLREEIQRAFLLHRFEVWLGGGVTGIIVTSAAFGAGHLIQGVDAGIATGLLGAFWGVVYLRRRSMIAPMVSHAGFDLLQIIAQVLFH